MKNRLFAFVLVFTFLFHACESKLNQETLREGFKKMSNEALLEKVRVGLKPEELRPLKLILLQRTEQPYSRVFIDTIIEIIQQRDGDNPYFLWNALTLKRSLSIERGELDSALVIARTCLDLQGTHDSISDADLFHDLGITFMNLNQPDSVLYYWKKAYLITEEQQDYKRITVTAFNLAAHYHNLGLYDISRKLFARTIEVMEMLGKKSPLLVNNIISTMIAREKYQEADAYWVAHEHELKGDIHTYEGQVMILNRAVLSERLGRYAQTDSILNALGSVQIEPLLLKDYLQTLVLQSIRLGNNELTDMRYADRIPHFAPLFLHNNYRKFSDFMRRSPWVFLKDTIEMQYQRGKINHSLDPRYLYAMGHYLAHTYQNSQPQKALQFFGEMAEFQQRIDSVRFQTDRMAFNELSDYEGAMSELVAKNILLESSENREIMYFVILLLLSCTLGLGFYSVRQKLVTSAAQSKWLEKEKAQTEELLVSNQRLVEYSKVILERNNTIKQRLNKLDLKGKSAMVLELKSIIKELDVLNKINTSEKPQVADHLIEKSKHQENHPHLSLLTKVEQRIYVLSQNDYRPKDIANMLGYSVQYVRNVKSRIAKKMEDEGVSL
jgi:DNA-binding CsgD family transcriptional regulator/tetratricopeptide (TPR) repeat protein